MKHAMHTRRFADEERETQRELQKLNKKYEVAREANTFN